MAGEGKRFAQTGERILKPFIKVDNEYMFVRAMNCIRKMFPETEIFYELVVRKETYDEYNMENIIKDMQYVHISITKKTSCPA